MKNFKEEETITGDKARSGRPLTAAKWIFKDDSSDGEYVDPLNRERVTLLTCAIS